MQFEETVGYEPLTSPVRHLDGPGNRVAVFGLMVTLVGDPRSVVERQQRRTGHICLLLETGGTALRSVRGADDAPAASWAELPRQRSVALVLNTVHPPVSFAASLPARLV
jgi:hypothetical protein